MKSYLALPFLLVFSVGMFMGFTNPEDTEVTLVGTVRDMEWDDDDNVTGVAIMVTEGEGDEMDTMSYFVTNDDKGRELIQYVSRAIEATGTLSYDDFDDPVITVTSYKLLD